ncbi:hypothetical protein V2G26_009660 [Clonostachys chloroleuca]
MEGSLTTIIPIIRRRQAESHRLYYRPISTPYDAVYCNPRPQISATETADPSEDENSCRAAPDIIESHPGDGCGRHEHAYVHEKQGLRHCIFTSPTTEPPSPASAAPVPAGVLIPLPSPTELRRIPPSAIRHCFLTLSRPSVQIPVTSTHFAKETLQAITHCGGSPIPA